MTRLLGQPFRNLQRKLVAPQAQAVADDILAPARPLVFIARINVAHKIGCARIEGPAAQRTGVSPCCTFDVYSSPRWR